MTSLVLDLKRFQDDSFRPCFLDSLNFLLPLAVQTKPEGCLIVAGQTGQFASVCIFGLGPGWALAGDCMANWISFTSANSFLEGSTFS